VTPVPVSDECLNDRLDPSQTMATAVGVSHDGTVIVGTCISVVTSPISEAFIWREDETPKVQKLAGITEGYKQSVSYNVIKKDDGTIIAVGNSTLRNGRGRETADRNGPCGVTSVTHVRSS